MSLINFDFVKLFLVTDNACIKPNDLSLTKFLRIPQNPLLGALGVPTSTSGGGLPGVLPGGLPGAGAPGGGDLASMFQMAQLQMLMNPAMAAAAAAGGQGPVPGLPSAPSPASLMQSQVRNIKSMTERDLPCT